jgi:GH35 family endo-1,4-beta-xylanase
VAWSGADLLTKHPGLERIDREVFSLAMEKTKLPMFINEDQIFRPGRQQDETYDYILGLQAEKFPVAGLGNQAHFDESFLPSPQELLEVTDRFAKIVPTQVITEFDITTTADEQLAADFTRDTMIACFSHPAYHGFILWGFWEGIHWKPEAASWNKDWSIRKRGEVLRDLIQKEWHTKVTIKTDAEGYATWRGFPGVYTVQSGNTTLPKLRVSLEKNR